MSAFTPNAQILLDFTMSEASANSFQEMRDIMNRFPGPDEEAMERGKDHEAILTKPFGFGSDYFGGVTQTENVWVG